MTINDLTLTEIAEGFERMFERSVHAGACSECGTTLRNVRQRRCAPCLEEHRLALALARRRRPAA